MSVGVRWLIKKTNSIFGVFCMYGGLRSRIPFENQKQLEIDSKGTKLNIMEVFGLGKKDLH